MKPLICVFAAGLAASGAQPAKRNALQLIAYPQKIVTGYKADAPEVPASVRTGHSRETVTTGPANWGKAVWRASSKGLKREQAWGPDVDRQQWFRGRRYLPDDQVEHIEADGKGGVWVRTATGVGHIALRPMTLEEKAAHFGERIRLRHDRYGMVADSALRVAGDLSTSVMESNDNDGLWTAMYAAAECYRYAATKSPEALARAKRATEAVLFLEQMTGRSGYPARSYIRQGDLRGEGGKWFWTPDRKIEWKSDTSSDELVGHFYLFGIAYDLLPDKALRKRIQGTARRIMDHILAHGYHLTDVNGEPTYWGRWSPEYFETTRGKPDAPLNAAELLSFLRTTRHVTGDARYEDEYRKVAVSMKYAELTTRLDELREELNYSDEELAMLSFYPLLRYERDPALTQTYLRAMEQWWANEKRERNPLWTFIYATANDPGTPYWEQAVHTLYRIPMDLRTWTVVNSDRDDLDWEPEPDRFGKRQTRAWIPPDERPVMKWNGNPFRVDGGNGGRGEDDGAFFLLPYWMGRYHGFLREPVVK